MTFQRGGSYHAGFLRGKSPTGFDTLFDDTVLIELRLPSQIDVRAYSKNIGGIDGYMIDVRLGEIIAKPFFIPLKEEVRYTKLNLQQYINGLRDGLMRRSADVRARHTLAKGV